MEHGHTHWITADDGSCIRHSTGMGVRNCIRLPIFVNRLINVVLVKRMQLARSLMGFFARMLHQT